MNQLDLCGVTRQEADRAKRCWACKNTKPAGKFYQAKRGDGLSSECKQCHKSIGKKRREAYKARNSAQAPVVAAKRCYACERTLDRECFPINRSNADGLHNACRECCSRRSKAHYEANREKVKARTKAYADRDRETVRAKQRAAYASNPEPMKAYQRSYRLENRDKVRAWQAAHYQLNKIQRRSLQKIYRANNRPRFRAYAEKYRRRNLALYAEKTRRRTAWKRNARIARFTMAQLMRRIEVFGSVCAYCGAPWEHVDHVKPLSRGGPHCLSNLRPACAGCNLSKGSTPPMLWLATLPQRASLPLP